MASEITDEETVVEDDASHILIIDDDSRIRELLSRYLTEQGFRVTTAAEAQEARRKLEGLSFDLLIVDVMMPGESGTDLTRSIRDELDVPVLMLTALGETEARIRGLEAGADDYLSKPFDPRELELRARALDCVHERCEDALGGGLDRLGGVLEDLGSNRPFDDEHRRAPRRPDNHLDPDRGRDRPRHFRCARSFGRIPR